MSGVLGNFQEMQDTKTYFKWTGCGRFDGGGRLWFSGSGVVNITLMLFNLKFSLTNIAIIELLCVTLLSIA